MGPNLSQSLDGWESKKNSHLQSRYMDIEKLNIYYLCITHQPSRSPHLLPPQTQNGFVHLQINNFLLLELFNISTMTFWGDFTHDDIIIGQPYSPSGKKYPPSSNKFCLSRSSVSLTSINKCFVFLRFGPCFGE